MNTCKFNIYFNIKNIIIFYIYHLKKMLQIENYTIFDKILIENSEI